MTKAPRISCNDLTRAIERAGFVVEAGRGKHRSYRHPSTQRRCQVPQHGSAIVPIGTLRNVLRQAGLTIEGLRRLL